MHAQKMHLVLQLIYSTGEQEQGGPGGPLALPIIGEWGGGSLAPHY